MKKTVLTLLLLVAHATLAKANITNLQTTKVSGVTSLSYQVRESQGSLIESGLSSVDYLINSRPADWRISEQRSLLIAILEQKALIKIPVSLSTSYCSLPGNKSSTTVTLSGTINALFETTCAQSHTTGYQTPLYLSDIGVTHMMSEEILSCLESDADCFPQDSVFDIEAHADANVDIQPTLVARFQATIFGASNVPRVDYPALKTTDDFYVCLLDYLQKNPSLEGYEVCLPGYVPPQEQADAPGTVPEFSEPVTPDPVPSESTSIEAPLEIPGTMPEIVDPVPTEPEVPATDEVIINEELSVGEIIDEVPLEETEEPVHSVAEEVVVTIIEDQTAVAEPASEPVVDEPQVEESHELIISTETIETAVVSEEVDDNTVSDEADSDEVEQDDEVPSEDLPAGGSAADIPVVAGPTCQSSLTVDDIALTVEMVRQLKEDGSMIWQGQELVYEDGTVTVNCTKAVVGYKAIGAGCSLNRSSPNASLTILLLLSLFLPHFCAKFPHRRF